MSTRINEKDVLFLKNILFSGYQRLNKLLPPLYLKFLVLPFLTKKSQVSPTGLADYAEKEKEILLNLRHLQIKFFRNGKAKYFVRDVETKDRLKTVFVESAAAH